MMLNYTCNVIQNLQNVFSKVFVATTDYFGKSD